MTSCTEEFIEKACEIHGSKFDYSCVEYVNARTPVTIVCIEHKNRCAQKPAHHLRGNNPCKFCTKRGLTQEDAICLFRQTHGDRFDYSRTEYSSWNKKIIVVCREHGEFSTIPAHHHKGIISCPGCNGQKPINRDEFIQRASKHKNSLDFSLVPEFEGNVHRKVPVSCIKHPGEIYEVSAWSLMRGSNPCLLCSPSGRKTPFDVFVMKARMVHSHKEYDYSLLKNKDIYAHSRGEIICPDHLDTPFTQILTNHLSGQEGCPQCFTPSQGEKQLAEFIESLGFNIVRNSRSIIPPKEVDIYVPEKNIAFEFNGVYWHTENQGKNRKYHYGKWQDCRDRGIQLITIWEDDWQNRKTAVKKMVAHKLGASNGVRIFARKTNVENIPMPIARDFCNTYHIQGFTNGTYYTGLFHESTGELVAVAIWRKQGSELRLERYCTSAHVVGGMGKILHAGKEYAHTRGLLSITTFSNNEISNGGLYEKLGFIKVKDLAPDYSYAVGNARKHKFGFRKTRFKNDPGLTYREGLTEKELACMNGLYRVWDCGKIKWELQIS